MNVNTTKLIPTFENCSGTAWKKKFKNSWNECDVWCEYMKYYYYASYIAQVYVISSPFIPKGAKLKFPFYVKTYNPELFSEYNFNNVIRKTNGVKDFIVSDEFTTAYDITSKDLYFYLNSDVKLPQSYVLDKFKTILLNFEGKISINGEAVKGNPKLIQLTSSVGIIVDISLSNGKCYCWDDWDTWEDYDNWEEV